MAARREYAQPDGFGEASKQAHFVAAPLLTAAALGLAGVVGGADDEFKWPGITLLLLVMTSMALIASIQMGYYALQFKFTEDEMEERRKARLWPPLTEEERRLILEHSQITYENSVRRANITFNAGTLMLGVGIAAALVPPDCADQPGWRTGAAVFVLLCTIADGVWIVKVLAE
ncbi:hypothetical protein [Streptomyces sp. NPDC055013]